MRKIMELVSVIVPVYNVELYLERCLNSIVNQTYRNLEIILVDDGSPDRCPDLCDEWARKDERVRVIHKTNAGLGMARNTGIETANGKYLCFVDSDDYIAPEMVEQAYQIAKAKHADLVVFGMKNVTSDGHIVGSVTPRTPKDCYSGREIQDVFLPDWIDSRYKGTQVKGLCLSACSCLFSANLIRKVQWRFVSERDLISEDSYSLIQLAEHLSCVAILEKALYYYCTNYISLTHTYRRDRFERIKKFYESCVLMVQQHRFSRTVEDAVAGVTFSFVVAAMKQIAESDLSKGEKRQIIAEIVSDETMEAIVRIVYDRYDGIARKLLLFGLRRKLTGLICLMLDMQIKKK